MKKIRAAWVELRTIWFRCS